MVKKLSKEMSKAITRKVKALQAVASEDKEQLNIQALTSLTTTAACTYLSGIVQGDTSLARTGFEVQAKALELHYFATLTTASSTSNYNPCHARVIIVQEREAQSGTPTTAYVPTALLVTPNNILSGYNTQFEDRFKVLHDKIHVLGFANNVATSSYGIGPGSIVVKKNIRSLNKRLIYVDGTANITGAGKGAIYMIYYTDTTVCTPQIQYWNKLIFTDD